MSHHLVQKLHLKSISNISINQNQKTIFVSRCIKMKIYISTKNLFENGWKRSLSEFSTWLKKKMGVRWSNAFTKSKHLPTKPTLTKPWFYMRREGIWRPHTELMIIRIFHSQFSFIYSYCWLVGRTGC